MPSYPQPANKWKFAIAFNDPHNELTAPDTVKYAHFPDEVKKIQNAKICSKAHALKYSQTHDTHRGGDHPRWVRDWSKKSRKRVQGVKRVKKE